MHFNKVIKDVRESEKLKAQVEKELLKDDPMDKEAVIAANVINGKENNPTSAVTQETSEEDISTV